MTWKDKLRRLSLATLFVVGCADGQTRGRGRQALAVEDGVSAFRLIHAVLMHPRCLNCHPRDDIPRQGDDQRAHVLGVVRGADNLGAFGMRCGGCHGASNQLNGVPGAPGWSLAPRSMGWAGLDELALCQQLKDRDRNGDRSLQDTLTHLTDDPLVLWAWAPGHDPGGKQRAPPPVSEDDFTDAVHTWVARGGPCPQPVSAGEL